MLTIDDLINKLRAKEFANVTNQYHAKYPHNNITVNNLKHYFEEMAQRNPHVALIGEAPGYNGCRLTGIPFTSEYIIQNVFNTLESDNRYLINNYAKPQKEPTATIVWQELNRLGLRPLLWNAFPFHPHKPNNFNTNRAPNTDELMFGLEVLKEILTLFNIEQVVAIGNVAHDLMTKNGINCTLVRHPSYGGKADFIAGLQRYIAI